MATKRADQAQSNDNKITLEGEKTHGCNSIHD